MSTYASRCPTTLSRSLLCVCYKRIGFCERQPYEMLDVAAQKALGGQGDGRRAMVVQRCSFDAFVCGGACVAAITFATLYP